LLFGLAGKSFSIFGFQQWLSLTVGMVILFFLFLPKKWKISYSANNIFSTYNSKIRAKLGDLFFKQNYQSLFTIGLLNGLLPCGLIYMAIAGAVVSADPLKSAFFMTSFGLGTLPVMWSVSFFGNYVGLGLRKKIRSAYPIMIGLMACLLILRGMGLGIPYVSPALAKNTHEIQMCYPVTQHENYKLK
jgi:sulfite exporter TauE/SafE